METWIKIVSKLKSIRDGLGWCTLRLLDWKAYRSLNFEILDEIRKHSNTYWKLITNRNSFTSFNHPYKFYLNKYIFPKILDGRVRLPFVSVMSKQWMRFQNQMRSGERREKGEFTPSNACPKFKRKGCKIQNSIKYNMNKLEKGWGAFLLPSRNAQGPWNYIFVWKTI